MNSPKKFKWFLLVLIGVSFGILPSLASAQEELFVSALDETGSTYIAPKDDIYRFTIIGGAYEHTPPESQPGHPELWGWSTKLYIYKNRPISWSTPCWAGYSGPGNWDFELGSWTLYETYQQAEEASRGEYIDLSLSQGDFVTFIIQDCKECCFWDNSGGVYLSISIEVICDPTNGKVLKIPLPPCNQANWDTRLFRQEAESGERIEVWCENWFGWPAYRMYYFTPEGKNLGVIGQCRYKCGCNTAWFRYADYNGDDVPDCFINTGWISKDYGHDDLEKNWLGFWVQDGRLDWFEYHFFVATEDLRKITREYDYRCGPPACPPVIVNERCCDGAIICMPPEGDLLSGPNLVPGCPVGEAQAFLEEQLLALQNYPASEIEMYSSPFELCDLDHDGDCDVTDFQSLRNAIGSCLGEDAYNPLADIDGDGCVTESDLKLLFPTIPADLTICPNTLNIKSKGKRIWCWIKLPQDYSVKDIDRDSLELSIPSCSDCDPINVTCGFPLWRRYLAFFSRQALIDEIETMGSELPSKLELRVSGNLEDGTLFEGLDSIRVIKRGRKNAWWKK